MALPPTTANWHWKNKDVTRWGKEWFGRELTTLTVKGDDEGEVSVSEVVYVDGDIELGQRKSKLITIYEVKIQLKWEGTAGDGSEVRGTLTIPEVSHEITVDGLSKYEYIWDMSTKSSPQAEALLALAKSRLPVALETKFAEFPSAMIDTHGKDITVSANASRSGTPAPSSAPASTSGAAPSTTSASSTSVGGAQPAKRKEARNISEVLNTTQVSVEASFMAAADDLFSLLTDEKRIPAWSRSAATSRAKPGTDYSIFDGNIVGKYISLTPCTEIKQSWMLKSPIWPAGHMATLTTTLKQSSDSTTLILSLDGVPTGMEGMIRTNLEGYYMQGLKSIGYVQLIHYNPPPPSISTRAISSPLSLRSNTRIAAVTFVALLAVFISYIHVFSSRK